MSKLDKVTRMSAPSMLWLLREMVKSENGISTKRLWDCVREWDKTGADKAPGEFAREFDVALSCLLAEGFKCTNKCIYRIGVETGPRRVRNPKEEDRRQLRMFG